MSSGSGPQHESVRWVQERFDASDKNTQDLKTAITGLSRGITLLKADLEGAKVAATIAAAGLTLIKADFTAFKIDEKGISLFGNQFKAWPWSDWSKRWERRHTEETKEISQKFTGLQNDIRELDRLKSRQATLQRGATAQGNASGNTYLLTREREVAQEIQELERRIRESQRTIEKSVRELKDSKVQKKFNELNEAKEEAEKAKKTAERNYESLQGILDDTTQTVESLARQLA